MTLSIFDVNTTFASRYRLKELLGKGGMGSVYLAVDTILGDEELAIKILNESLTNEEKYQKRFLREIQLTRKITHPNIVRTFDVGKSAQYIYFTMEYLQGESLKDILERGPVPCDTVVTYLKDITKALSAIHEAGIIHRDLKPANVIVSNKKEIKLTDFGLARYGDSDITKHDEVVGSLQYISTELWLGRDFDARADLYSLGVLTYELLTGVVPFDGDTPHDIMRKHIESKPVKPSMIVEGIPEWLEKLTLRMLSKEPKMRPSSAQELLILISEERAEEEFPLYHYGTTPTVFEREPHVLSKQNQQQEINNEISKHSGEDVLLQNGNDHTVNPLIDIIDRRHSGEVRVSKSILANVNERTSYPQMRKGKEDSLFEVLNENIVLKILFIAPIYVLTLFIGIRFASQFFLCGKYLQQEIHLARFWEYIPITLYIFLLNSAIISSTVYFIFLIFHEQQKCIKVWIKFFGVILAGSLFFILQNTILLYQNSLYINTNKFLLTKDQYLSGIYTSLMNSYEIIFLNPIGSQFEPVQGFMSPVLVKMQTAELFPGFGYLCTFMLFLYLIVIEIREKFFCIKLKERQLIMDIACTTSFFVLLFTVHSITKSLFESTGINNQLSLNIAGIAIEMPLYQIFLGYLSWAAIFIYVKKFANFFKHRFSATKVEV
jgi:serine/threonine protein kinase